MAYKIRFRCSCSGCSRAALVGAVFVAYLIIKYTPVDQSSFSSAAPVHAAASPSARARRNGRFHDRRWTSAFRQLFAARTEQQSGLVVYCHEYLSDRWSFQPYVDHLRDLGYDLFTFDFRNHGTSDSEPAYDPMQWTSDREVRDLRAALAYLRTRPDHDPAGFGLFGVSRGGTTALLAAAVEDDVWGVVTDGAFPTQGTMIPYIVRWAEIYVESQFIRNVNASVGLQSCFPGMLGGTRNGGLIAAFRAWKRPPRGWRRDRG